MIFHNIKYALVSVGVFLTDFGIKNHIEETGTEGEEKEALCGRLLLRKYHNQGAFLDAGEKHSPLVAALSLALTLALTVVFVLTFGMKGGSLLKTGLALLLGGAYSNTYDRLRRHYVVDYVSFPVKNKKIRNVVFNISDFCIMIGALCMVLAQWGQELKR
jgi:signal peptidase II